MTTVRSGRRGPRRPLFTPGRRRDWDEFVKYSPPRSSGLWAPLLPVSRSGGRRVRGDGGLGLPVRQPFRFRVGPPEDRRRDDGREERHHHEPEERRRREDAEVGADVDDDERHEGAGVRQEPDRQRLLPGQAGEAGGERGRAELRGGRHGDDDQERPPEPGVRAERPEVGAQSREDEEDRQEEDRHQVADGGLDGLGQITVEGSGHAAEEAAQDGEDAEGVRRGREAERHDQHAGEGPRGQAARGRPGDPDPCDGEPPEQPERGAEHEDARERGGEGGRAHAALGRRHDDGAEQEPAEGVVEGRGRDRRYAHPRAREPRVHEDAAHDRDRRDRDGGGEEEPEGRRRGASRRERVEVAPHGEARREGDDDTGGGHGGGGLRRADEPVERELEANQEHEEDQPDLREGGEDRRRLPREERGDRPWIQVAEDGGAKDDPAQDLADDGRLSGEAEDPARDAGGGDDDREIRAEEEERLLNGE